MANKRKSQSDNWGSTGSREPRHVGRASDTREIDKRLDPEVRSDPDFAADEEFWRSQYQSRPYYQPNTGYSDYEPAYRCGYESAKRHSRKKFDEITHELERDWDKVKGKSSLAWEHAKEAIRDAWDKVTGK